METYVTKWVIASSLGGRVFSLLQYNPNTGVLESTSAEGSQFPDPETHEFLTVDQFSKWGIDRLNETMDAAVIMARAILGREDQEFARQFLTYQVMIFVSEEVCIELRNRPDETRGVDSSYPDEITHVATIIWPSKSGRDSEMRLIGVIGRDRSMENVVDTIRSRYSMPFVIEV